MYEEMREISCAGCGATNHVLIFYSGDSRANADPETASCYKCRGELLTEDCCWIFSASTPEAAKAKLRMTQGAT